MDHSEKPKKQTNKCTKSLEVSVEQMDLEEEKRKRPAGSEYSAREDSLSSCTEDGLSLSKVKRKRRRSKEADNGDGEDVILSKWSVLESKMQDLVMENNQLKTQLECHQTYLPIQKTYAPAVGTSVGQSLGPEACPEDENDKITNEEIKTKVMSVLKKDMTKLKVRNIRQLRSKGLVVEVNSKVDVEIIKNSGLQGEGLKMAEPRKLDPSLIIYDVEKEHKAEDLKNELICKNFDGYNDQEKVKINEKINFKYCFKTKNEGKVNWIVQLPVREYHHLIKINAQRSMAAMADIRKVMQDESLDLLCIQEPYVFKNKVRGITAPLFEIFQPSSVYPWVAIVMNKRRVEAFQISTRDSDHIMCIQVRFGSFRFFIVNLYCQFSLSIEDFLRDLEGLLNDIDRSRVVICMDANAKSIAWFSDETNQNGSLLEEFIIAQGLNILNKPSNFPTYISGIGESNRDVILASPFLCNLIQRWSVSDKVVASDHNLISFRIVHKHGAVNLKMVKESYNIKAADWDKFGGLLSTELDENCLTRMLELSADDFLKKLYRILTDVCRRSIPRRKISNRAFPWWNESLERLRSGLRRSRKQFSRARRLQCDNLEQCKEIYRKARNNYVKEIRKAKNASWRDFVSTEGNRDPWGIMHKIVKNKLQNQLSIGSLVLPSGERTKSWEESVTALLHKFAPRDNLENETIIHKTIRETNNNYKNSNLEPEISYGEIGHALGLVKNKKAPGLDGFGPEIVKALWTNCKEAVHNLFNKCLRECKFLKAWKVAKLVIIPKNPEASKQLIGSYRPIALLSVLSKVFERIIVNRIQMHLHKRDILPGAECPLCGFPEETVQHIMFNCTEYTPIRYVGLEENADDWKKIIETKEGYNDFVEFAQGVFDKRTSR
ncbi:hypothetical protein KPH14_012616 [Odynerus spinipes]|uniref:Endonuclease/exonuclease/phosphatase domain-containing protein n=1 Tax=Odynerus spinipes TaxID=1348599 RepID=A0AAD9VL58_9HYME|nr:hypothetical protein KPH14_012616 [Odynerus spinipes]